MCTPVGHSLCGVLIWTMLALPARRTLGYLWRWARRQWEGLLLAVLMANLCDLDYLPGLFFGELNAWHHMYTHSIGWVVLAGVGTCLVWKGLEPATEDKCLLIVALALLSHLALDWLTRDGGPPFGILLGWPFSLERTVSPIPLFPAVSKPSFAEIWRASNGVPFLFDLVFFLVLIALALAWKTRRAAPESPSR
jgi:membrane-bound metal-dependent hydrolase YbcI (DUF457 family)